MEALIKEERARYPEAPLFAGLPGEFEAEAAEEEFWDIISAQIIQGLDEFARQQARGGRTDQTFFTGEATKGLRLLDLMLRQYDVVVTNPPYLSRRKMNKELKNLVSDAYPKARATSTAFIQRCLEFAEKRGYVGMLTMHSFMFISSYETCERTYAAGPPSRPWHTADRRSSTWGIPARCRPRPSPCARSRTPRRGPTAWAPTSGWCTRIAGMQSGGHWKKRCSDLRLAIDDC